MVIVAQGSAQAVRASRQTLRPYQEAAYEATRQAYREGKRAVVLVLPTGGGKTTIGSRFAVSAEAKGHPVLWMANREELIDQARDRLLAEGVKRAGVIMGGRPTMNAPVQVAGIDTLVSRAARGLPSAKVVIFDECHHGAADTYREIVKHYRDQGAVILGLTATPERGDGRALGDVFDHLIPVSSVRELQGLGVLVPCVTYSPKSYQKALSMDPVAAYLSRTPGERAFVFARDVRHAEAMTLSFIAQGVHAAAIHGNTPMLLRKARLEAFRLQERAPLLAAGTVEPVPLVLCNAYVLTEGVDVPAAAHAILCRGCGHPGMMLQMVGRVLRSAPGKERAVFSDLCGVTRKRGFGVPEADRRWSLEGRAIELDEREYERPLLTCPACEGTVSTWATDHQGWRICPLCKQRLSAPEPVVVERKRQHVWGATAPLETREKMLEKWARTAAAKGYKPGWISVQYKEAFGGEWPRRREVERLYAQAIDDQGHAPPDRAAPVPAPPRDACPTCGQGPTDCMCQAG